MSDMARLVGQRIREYRTKMKLSQDEFADRAKLHATHFGQIERGEKSPTLDSLEKIVNALGITFEELFSFHQNPAEIKDPVVDNIISCLRTMTESEQKDIYRTIKMLMKWKKKS